MILKLIVCVVLILSTLHNHPTKNSFFTYHHFISLSLIPISSCRQYISLMGAENYRKSGQIPAFGDWENANELPITQYFECARQAGLLRCTCSRECGGAYANNAAYWGGAGGFEKPLPLPRRLYAVPERKTKGMNKGYPQSKEQRKQVKVRDLMNQPQNQPLAHKHQTKQQNNRPANLVQQKSSISAKPVDEDLYKIPPELLENSKRKKMLGFFSKCMVPPCAT